LTWSAPVAVGTSSEYKFDNMICWVRVSEYLDFSQRFYHHWQFGRRMADEIGSLFCGKLKFWNCTLLDKI